MAQRKITLTTVMRALLKAEKAYAVAVVEAEAYGAFASYSHRTARDAVDLAITLTSRAAKVAGQFVMRSPAGEESNEANVSCTRAYELRELLEPIDKSVMDVHSRRNRALFGMIDQCAK